MKYKQKIHLLFNNKDLCCQQENHKKIIYQFKKEKIKGS